jgi:hypothetical protein
MEVIGVDKNPNSSKPNETQEKAGVGSSHSRRFVESSSGREGSNSSSHVDGVSNPIDENSNRFGYYAYDSVKKYLIDCGSLDISSQREMQKSINELMMETYGSQEVFICKVDDKFFVKPNANEFVGEAEGEGFSTINIDELKSKGSTRAKRLDEKGNEIGEFNIENPKSEDKLKILERKQNEIIDNINQYEQQLSGRSLGSEIYRCEVVRENANGENAKREVYTAGSLDELAKDLCGKLTAVDNGNITVDSLKEELEDIHDKRKVDKPDGNNSANSKEGRTVEIRFIPLYDAAEKLKKEVEGLKDETEAKAREIFGKQYDDKNGIYKIKVGDQDSNVECNLDSIESVLREKGLENSINNIIGTFNKGKEKEKEKEWDSSNICCKVKDGKLELFEKENENQSIYSVEKLGLRKASEELEELKKKYEKDIDDLTSDISAGESVIESNANPSLKDKCEALNKWRKKTTERIMELENRHNNKYKGAEQQLTDKNVSYLYEVVIDDGIESGKKEFRYYESQDNAKQDLNYNIESMKVKREGSEREEKFGGQVHSDQNGNNLKSIKRMGLDEVVQELEKYYERKEKDFKVKLKNLYEKVTGGNIKHDPNSNEPLQLYAHEINGRVYITEKPEIGTEDLKKVRAQSRSQEGNTRWGDYVQQEDIDAVKQAGQPKVKSIGLDDAYKKLESQVEGTRDRVEANTGGDQNRGEENTGGDQNVTDIRKLYKEIFGEGFEPKRDHGFLLTIEDNAANKELRRILEMGKEDKEKFLTVGQLEALAKEHPSIFREFCDTASQALEQNKFNSEIDVPSKKGKIKCLDLNNTKKNLEEMQKKMNNDIKEIFAVDKGEDEKFYVYRVADVGPQSNTKFAGMENGHVIVLNGKQGAVTNEVLKGKFSFGRIEGDENIKDIKIGEKIKYFGGEENSVKYIELERISLKTALDQEKERVRIFVDASQRLGDNSISGGEDATSWKSIRYYKIKDNNQPVQYEAAKNPKHMAERIAERLGGVDKIHQIGETVVKKEEEGVDKTDSVGENEVDSSKALETLTKAIKAAAEGQESSVKIVRADKTPFCIENSNSTEMVDFLNKEKGKIEKEIRGPEEKDKVSLIKRYENARKENLSLGLYDRPRKISLNDFDKDSPKDVYATWKRDKDGEKTQLVLTNEKLTDSLSLTEAKQELERIIEDEKVPGNINNTVFNVLEKRLKEEFQKRGITEEVWNEQKNGEGKGIKFCCPPPKYVFVRTDAKTGQETYCFSNSYKRAAETLGLKNDKALEKEVKKKNGNIRLVPLDSKAWKALENCAKQDQLAIQDLGDIHQFKDGNGKWYITNASNFDKNFHNFGRGITLERTFTDFYTGWGTPGDSKKKKKGSLDLGDDGSNGDLYSRPSDFWNTMGIFNQGGGPQVY